MADAGDVSVRTEFVGATSVRRGGTRRSIPERVYAAVQIVFQVALRAMIVLLALGVQTTTSGSKDTGAWSNPALKDGTAVITACGPLTWWPVPIEWGSRCAYDITWSTGETARGDVETVYLGAADVGRTLPVVLVPGSGRVGPYPSLRLDAPYEPVGNVVLAGGILFALLAPVWIPWRSRTERAEVRRRRRMRMPPWLMIVLGYGLAVGGAFGFVTEPPTEGLPGWGPLTWPPLLALVVGLLVVLRGFVAAARRRGAGHPPSVKPPVLARSVRLAYGGGLQLVGSFAALGIAREGLGSWSAAVLVTRLTLPAVLLVLGAHALLVWFHQTQLPRNAVGVWRMFPYLDADAARAAAQRDAAEDPPPGDFVPQR